jgi:hypothetical protein
MAIQVASEVNRALSIPDVEVQLYYTRRDGTGNEELILHPGDRVETISTDLLVVQEMGKTDYVVFNANLFVDFQVILGDGEQ